MKILNRVKRAILRPSRLKKANKAAQQCAKEHKAFEAMCFNVDQNENRHRLTIA